MAAQTEFQRGFLAGVSATEKSMMRKVVSAMADLYVPLPNEKEE